MEDPNLSLELQRLTVTICYNVDTRILSFKDGSSEWIGTSEDNLSAQIKVEGIGNLLYEYTAELVFGIPMYHNGVIYHPIGQIDAATDTYVLPNAILASAKDGILPTELRLTRGTDVITSRNALPISVATAIDALRPFDGAYLPEIMGRSQEWAADVQYAKGAVVIRDEVLYYSRRADNLGHDPNDGNISWWREVSVVQEYQTYIGDGVSTQFTVTHHMLSPDLQFTVSHNGTDLTGDVTDMTAIDENTASFTFSSPPPADTLLRINEAYRAISSPMWVWGMLESEEGMIAPEALFGMLEITDEKVTVRNGELGVNSSGRAYAGPEGLTKVLANEEDLTAHIIRTDNPHSVTKMQIGLSNVDNTSDTAKPISTATQTALNAKQDSITGGATTITSSNLTASRALVSNGSGKVAVSAVTSTELGYLDGVTSAVQTQLNSKASDTNLTAHTSKTNNPHSVTKAQVGLEFADNTTDANKPISTATQTALDGKVSKTGNESIAGIKTFSDNVEIGTALVPKQLSIKGNLLIDGNITQNGSAYETHAQQVYTTDDKIIMRDGATAGLISGATSGLTFNKYDGTNDGELSVDSSGTARVGDVGDLQPLATRNEAGSMTNNQPVVWDSSGLKMVTRALVAGDIPDLDAGKIKSGTIADARIPSGITRDTELTAHTGRTDNPHSVTKMQIGLERADNTTDMEKPVSYAVQALADTKANADEVVLKNPPISPGTHTKVTYDEDGLIVGGDNISGEDIPEHSADLLTSGTVSDERITHFVERIYRKTSAWTPVPSDDRYPTEKLVKDSLDLKADITEGVEAWSPSVSYSSGAITNVGGTLYASLISNNRGNDPDLSPDKWMKYTASSASDPALQDAYVTTIGDGTSTEITVTHSLNTEDVMTELYSLTGEKLTIDSTIIRANVNQITIRFSTPPATDSVRVMVSRPGTSVRTVNGLHGDVVLDYDDVGAVEANAAITPGTNCKITYDSKGLVTKGTSLVASDIPYQPASKINSGTFADARIPTLAISKTTGLQSALDAKIPTSVKGSPNGVAELDATGKVPSGQLPSYVDDVLEYASLAGFPTTGESGKIYVAIDTNKTYRWSGTGYVEISPSLALGETSATAYRGDRGAQAYAHISATNNPHSVTKAQVGLSAVANELQYSASNPPPYPVTSVAGKTGAVTLAEADIPALSAGKITSGAFADARIPTTVERTANKKSAWQITPSDSAYPSEALVKSELDKKVDSNPTITAGTNCKISFDEKGLVTGGNDLADTDIPDLDADKIASGTLDLARIPVKKYAGTITGNGILDTFTLAHSLGGTPLLVQMTASDGRIVDAAMTVTATDISVSMTTPPASGTTYNLTAIRW